MKYRSYKQKNLFEKNRKNNGKSNGNLKIGLGYRNPVYWQRVNLAINKSMSNFHDKFLRKNEETIYFYCKIFYRIFFNKQKSGFFFF